MTVGIDIDGTATKYPEFFVQFGLAWRRAGHRVLLITGLGQSGVQKKLEKYGWLREATWYDGIIDTSRYNAEERKLIGVERDNERIVGRFKQRICREEGVVVMFDDKAAVHREFGSIPIFEVQ